MLLDGKVALVTGGSRGIGRAIAIRLAQEGARVAVNYAGNQTAAEEVKAIIEEQGGTAMLVQADVSDSAAATEMVTRVHEEFGGLDILVNNAGISQKVTVADMTLEDMERIFKVNMFGLFLVTQACMKPMVAAKYGRIVNLSSVSAKRGGGIFGGAHYSAAKAAVLAFSKNLSREISKDGVTINSVCPGLINTEIWKSLDKSSVEKILDDIPMKRPGETQEVADTIVFLASKEASYITGEEIDINGGSHMD